MFFLRALRVSAIAPALLYLLHNPQGCGECRFCMEQKSVHAVVRGERKCVTRVCSFMEMTLGHA